MNPFIENALRRLVPVLLVAVGGWLVSSGLLTQEESEQFVGLVTTMIVAGALSVFQSYRSRREKLTGLAMPPGSTESDVKATVKAGLAPSVSTPANVIPELGRNDG